MGCLEGFLGEGTLEDFSSKKKKAARWLITYVTLYFRVYMLYCKMHNKTSLIPTLLEKNLNDEKLRALGLTLKFYSHKQSFRKHP
jgi:hypothetical protein